MGLSSFSYLLGGIGLFLIGMKLMSDGLETAAGGALHSVLERATRSRFSAFFSGAFLTGLIQSSSATTVAVIGFVSSGLLTLSSALAVIIGANVGTTSTGWIVSTLGFKVSVSSFALPLIGFGGIAHLVLGGRRGQFGLALAGFGLIFVGIEALENGMGSMAAAVDLSRFGTYSFGGQVLLVLTGLVVTALVQSSSVAVALTLTALASGSIDLVQAAYLVIGQNLGTTVTAALAALGASVPARRAALGHILFNVIAAVLAFFAVDYLLTAVHWLIGPGSSQAISLAMFHTLFNVTGAAVALPLTGALAWTVTKLIPDRRPSLSRFLDRSVMSVPSVALEASFRALCEALGVSMEIAARYLHGNVDDDQDRNRLRDLESGNREVQDFLGAVPIPPDQVVLIARRLDLIHASDHVQRLIRALLTPETGAPEAAGVADAFETVVAGMRLTESMDETAVELLRSTSVTQAERRKDGREGILARTASGALPPSESHAVLVGEAWVDRIAFHAWRAGHHLGASIRS